MTVPPYVNNYTDWVDYVETKIDEHENWIRSRERDLEMANLRLQRLLDATLQRLGESESALLPESENVIHVTESDSVGHIVSSSSVKTSE